MIIVTHFLLFFVSDLLVDESLLSFFCTCLFLCCCFRYTFSILFYFRFRRQVESTERITYSQKKKKKCVGTVCVCACVSRTNEWIQSNNMSIYVHVLAVWNLERNRKKNVIILFLTIEMPAIFFLLRYPNGILRNIINYACCCYRVAKSCCSRWKMLIFVRVNDCRLSIAWQLNKFEFS